jgi:maleylpyruvate isomerase
VAIMTDPAADLAALEKATDRLITAAAALDAADLAAPSQLPGWSRGHVLAHVSRNADALVNVLRGRPMYVSPEARDADIERDAVRSPEVQLADLRDSAKRFQQVAAGFSAEEWSKTVELRNGVTDAAAAIPFRRMTEVELHHVDLGIGLAIADLPAAFTDRALVGLARRFTGHPDVPALELRVTDGRTLTTGGAAGGPQAVTGSPADLVGWLAGRTGGSGLTTDGAALPVLPPL